MERRWQKKLVCFLVAALFGLVVVLYAAEIGEKRQETMMSENEDALLQSNQFAFIPYLNEKTVIVPEWDKSPIIDGQLNESYWENSAVLTGFSTAYYGHSLQDSVNYKLAYDQEHLYIGGHISRDEADTLARIEIVIQPETEQDHHFVVTIDIDDNDSTIGTTYWEGHLVENFVNTKRVEVNPTTYKNLFTEAELYTELAIPLSALASNVQAGDEWNLNIVHVHRIYERPLSSWVPIRNSQHWDRGSGSKQYHANVVDQGRLGNIFFKQFPDHFAPNFDDLTENDENESKQWDSFNAELIYRSFLEKQFIVDLPAEIGNENAFKLEWKEPRSNWIEIVPEDVEWAGNQLSFLFQHPQPLVDGLYQLRISILEDDDVTTQVAHMMIDREAMINAGLSLLDWATPDEPITTVSPEQASTRVLKTMELIPQQPGYRYVGLPEMPELYPDGLYSLSNDGKSLIATRTGTLYPNEEYEETREIVTENAKGEIVRIPYYEDEDGQTYLLSGHLWYLQRQRAMGETRLIARTDPLGAARLLYRFAEVYEGYNPTVDQAWHYESINRSAGPPYSYWGGMWYRFFGSDLYHLIPLLDAYAEVKKTDAFVVLSEEVGEDVENKIVEEMFLPSLDYILTYPLRLGNLSYTNWNGMIEVGKALNDPDYIHRVVESMQKFIETLFLSDGFWQEVSVHYHAELLSGINNAMNRLKGWSDPEGYISPRTGMHLENLDMARDFPIIGKAMEMENLVVYPDGKHYPIQDTWAFQSAVSPQIDAGSFLLPAAGIGRLAAGHSTDQTQLYMHFPPRYKSHQHYDPLHLSIYAERQELLPDLGYTFNTFYRWFALSTMSHNTVVVDSKNASIAGDAIHGGSIEAFIPQNELFKTLRASYEESYDSVSEYRREPWFIPFGGGDGQQGYILDIFRVNGGNRHEYTLQGDANHDAYFMTDLPLTEYGPYLLPPGTEVIDPVSNSDSGRAEGHYPGYIYVRDVQEAELNDDQYSLTLVTERAGNQQAKLKITGLLEPGSNELYLGRSPSLRAARLEGRSKDNNDEAVKYTMPKMVLRRDGNDLQSTFVTLMEPYRKETSKIEVIERLHPEEAPEGAAAIQVIYGDTTDILLSNPDYADHGQPLKVQKFTLHGEMGLIRLVDGILQDMSLVGGPSLQVEQQTLTSTGMIGGEIKHVNRKAEGEPYNAFITTTFIETEAIGRYVVVEHPDGSTRGYEIDDVLHEQGDSIIVLADEDPGFTIANDGTSKQVFHPAKQWEGAHNFTILNIDQVRGLHVDVNEDAAMGTITGTIFDRDEQPLSGVQVNVTGYPSIAAITDQTGKFTLNDVPAGRRWVTASIEGYPSIVSRALVIVEGQVEDIALSFSRKFPPVLSGIEVSGVRLGDSTKVTSSTDGAVYLVPSETQPTREAIEEAVVTVQGTVYGLEVPNMAGVPITLDTEGMLSGQYSIYAIDDDGNVSAGKSFYIVDGYEAIVDDSNENIFYSGTWTQSTNENNFGGTSMQSRVVDSFVEIPFYGKRAKVLSLVGGSRGKADVFVDDIYQETIDTYSPNVRYQHEIYDTGELSTGVHVLKLVVNGERNASATGNFVNFDVLQVDQPLLDAMESFIYQSVTLDEINAVVADQLYYRLDMIRSLHQLDNTEEAIAYMLDFRNYLNDSSIADQHLISERVIEELNMLATKFVEKLQ